MVMFAVHLLPSAQCFTGCPRSHSKFIKCANKNLTAIPSWIPSDVLKLDLSHNPLRNIREDSFARFTNLKVLDLGHCSLNQHLKLPKSLRKINLKYNGISINNAAATFKGMSESQIVLINLNGNKLTLDGNLSIFPKSVQYLQLNYNILKRIESNDFESLTSLRYLDISHNGLCRIAKGAFKYLRQLKEINIEYNTISMNDVAAIFRGNSESQITSINLNGNNLMMDENFSIFPRSVEKLDLNANILTKLEANDFEGFTNLAHLDISYTGLRQVAKRTFKYLGQLTHLRLNNNNITALPRRSFCLIHISNISILDLII